MINRESQQSKEAFEVYKSLGPGRKLRQAALLLGKSYSLLKRWSAKYNWVERILTVDLARIRSEAEALERERLRMCKIPGLRKRCTKT